ncbi:hypothetical protein B0H19DRAFT_1073869 [Mycena capillaripes]|nr:hypothetical protein B0H19DRAFT_1073869 [Mycena capillaripes]
MSGGYDGMITSGIDPKSVSELSRGGARFWWTRQGTRYGRVVIHYYPGAPEAQSSTQGWSEREWTSAKSALDNLDLERDRRSLGGISEKRLETSTRVYLKVLDESGRLRRFQSPSVGAGGSSVTFGELHDFQEYHNEVVPGSNAKSDVFTLPNDKVTQRRGPGAYRGERELDSGRQPARLMVLGNCWRELAGNLSKTPEGGGRVQREWNGGQHTRWNVERTNWRARRRWGRLTPASGIPN